MKRILLAVGIIAQLALAQGALAYTVTFGDTANNWTGWTNATDPNDTVGSPMISGGTATMNNGALEGVTFNADHFQDAGLHYYAGDLFINLLTTANDTTWDYVVRSLGDKTGGIYGIFEVNVSALKGVNDANYVLSNWTDNPSYASYRELHPIGVTNATLGTQVGTATFSGLSVPKINGVSTVSYNFAQSAIDLSNQNFILGWTVNCANDVVYQQVPVPEPGTMMLLGMGMLSLAVFGKRRMNKVA